MQKTIIFIHGAWVTPKCWDRFASFFIEKGYRVIAPSWPFKEKTVEEQQKNPDPGLAHLGIKEIVDYYAEIIKKETGSPILIGHSFGGLFVQMLLDRGLGSAGIAIDPAPPKGVFSLYPSAIWGLRFTLLTPFGWRRALHWPFRHFRYAFVHTLSPQEQLKAYKNYVVPESGRIFWQAALSPLTNTLHVNFKNNTRSPLLIIAGGLDHVVPAAVNRSNYKKYLGSKSRTDFKEFPGRVHWIIAEPGWQEIAEYISNWISSQK
ncbi:MAG: alpha/beta hydrolase [bacterium]|nr:alpha/beta hydrolase [bacterium]